MKPDEQLFNKSQEFHNQNSGVSNLLCHSYNAALNFLGFEK